MITGAQLTAFSAPGRGPRVSRHDRMLPTLSGGLTVWRVLRTGGRRLGPGLAWAQSGGAIAAAGESAACVWNLARPGARPAVYPFATGAAGAVTAVFTSGRHVHAVRWASVRPIGPSRLCAVTFSGRSLRRINSTFSTLPIMAHDAALVGGGMGGWLGLLDCRRESAGTLYLFNARNVRSAFQQILLYPRWNTAFACARKKLLAIVSGGHRVHIYADRTGPRFTRLATVRVAGPALRVGCFSPWGRRIVLLCSTSRGSPDGRVCAAGVTSNAKTERLVTLRSGGATFTAPPAISPNGRLAVISAAGAGGAKCWIVRTRNLRPLYFFIMRGDLPLSFAFSPGGGRLAIGGVAHVLIIKIAAPQPLDPRWLPRSAVRKVPIRGAHSWGGRQAR